MSLYLLLKFIHVLAAIIAVGSNMTYGVLLISGLLMVWLGPVRLTASWLLASLILYVVVAVLGAGVLAPLSSREMEMLRSLPPDDPAYLRLRRQSARLSGVAALLVLVIAFLMVTKPLP